MKMGGVGFRMARLSYCRLTSNTTVLCWKNSISDVGCPARRRLGGLELTTRAIEVYNNTQHGQLFENIVIHTTMGESETKRVKTEYELTYWPGIPGRGEVVRLLFEETATPYIDVAKGKKAVDAVFAYSDLKNVGDEANPPKFAPPVLKHGELVINQLPNILLYLAPKLGLGPASGDGVYHLNEIALTILDGFLNEVHETHHPIGAAQYYEDQKDEAKKRSKGFREERLPKYLAYVQRVLDGERSGEGGWLYGGELTYVDLVLFQVSLCFLLFGFFCEGLIFYYYWETNAGELQCLDGTKYAFPKTVEKLKEGGKYAGVFKLYDAVRERPNVKAYLESDRRVDYAEGIWRYYPELEGEEK